MSVEKVNKYKEYKKNKKEILEKEKKQKKFNRIIGWTAGIVVAAGLLTMIGITVKSEYTEYVNSKPTYEAEGMVVSDMTGILTELEAAEE